MLPLVTAGLLRLLSRCLSQAVMLALANCQYKGIPTFLMQQQRRFSLFSLSNLTWLCTPVLLFAALMAIPAGDPACYRFSQLFSSPRFTALRSCQAIPAGTVTIQQIDVFTGARSETLPGSTPPSDTLWPGASLLYSRQTSTMPQASKIMILHAETLPPSPHSAAHPAVFFALSPPFGESTVV